MAESRPTPKSKLVILPSHRGGQLQLSTMEVSTTENAYSRKPGFTETRLRPLARRRDNTFWPPWVLMRTRKPCFLLRLRRLGWNVRLGMKKSRS